MDTTEINRILRTNPVTKRVYIGCFPSDMLPVCRKFPCAMVVNFDESNEPGTHWIAIFAPTPRHVYYFDSLAGPLIPNLERYLYKNFRYVSWLMKPLQA